MEVEVTKPQRGVIREINGDLKAPPTRPARHRVKCPGNRTACSQRLSPSSTTSCHCAHTVHRVRSPPPSTPAMTAFLPLEAATPLPPSPAFLVPSPDPAHHMKRVVKAVLKARRIAVVCGEWRGYVLPWCAVGSLNAVLQSGRPFASERWLWCPSCVVNELQMTAGDYATRVAVAVTRGA